MFPTALPISDLIGPDGAPLTHPDYHYAAIQKRLDFYEGGENFDVEKYLWKRPIDNHAQIGKQVRNARVNLAYYSNQIAPHVWDVIAQICDTPLAIEVADNAQTADTFWTDLQANADGKGASAETLVRSALENFMVLDRAFYLVTFPGDPDATSNETIAQRLQYPPEISVLESECVRDWAYDSRGDLSRVRIDGMTLTRAPGAVAGAFDREAYTWTYYDHDGTSATKYIYTATKKKGDTWPKDATAMLLDSVPVGDELPIFDVRSPINFKLVGSWMPVADTIFQAKSDRRYFTGTAVTMAPYFTGIEPNTFGADGMSMPLSPFGGPALPVGADMKRDNVQPGSFQALDEGIRELVAELAGVVQSGAKQAAVQSAGGQNTSRMTGAAAASHAKPFEAFLYALAVPQLNAWQRIVDYIQTMRGSDDDVTVSGLCTPDDDDDAVDDNIARAQILTLIPQTPPPVMEMLMKEIGAGMADEFDADQDTRDAIANVKIMALPIEAYAPPAAPPDEPTVEPASEKEGSTNG